MTQEEYRESLMKNKTLDELEEEYQLSLSYLEELKNVYNKDGSLDKTNKREFECHDDILLKKINLNAKYLKD